MIWGLKKQYFFYLKGSHLLGAEWRGGEPRTVVDTSLEELYFEPGVKGEATLLVDREGLRHQIVSVPPRGRFSVKKMMAHEVESLMGSSPAEVVYDWREMGTSAEEESLQELYLLAAHERPGIISLLHELNQQGIRVSRIISTLDLLIAKGGALHTTGGSSLMVFEDPLVHFIFFRDGIYGFQRTFELRGEGFAKDLLLEIQRSFFYTKQKFKIPIEKVHILLAPEWLQGDLAVQLGETLAVPVDFLSPRLSDCKFPQLKLLNVLLSDLRLLPSLLDLLPKEILRTVETRKLAWAIAFTEMVLLCLALLWTYNHQQSWERDQLFSTLQARQLRSVQSRLEGQQDNLVRYRQLEADTAMVSDYLSRKKTLHQYLASLHFLIPENVYLESITYGASASEEQGQGAPGPIDAMATEGTNVLTVRGKVDSASLDERYALFFHFLRNLEGSPFVERADYQSEELIAQGSFAIHLHLKTIRAAHGPY